MSLVDRLAGLVDPDSNLKLPVETFHASMYELAAGKVTQQQIVNYFSLDAGEQTELQWIIDKYNSLPTAVDKEKFIELLRVVFVMAESQVPGYTTNAELTARLNAG